MASSGLTLAVWTGWWQQAGAVDLAAIALGAAGVIGGLVLVAMSRRLSERSADRAALARERGVAAPVAWSLGSIAALGLAVGAMGYHLVMWHLPPALTPLMASTAWWWVVPVAGAALVGLSRWIDGAEAARLDREAPAGRDGNAGDNGA